MADRRRYDSAMFWLAFGTAAAVIGLALMTIGVTRSSPGANLLASLWFDVGLAILAIGGLLLLWALVLYLARRRDEVRGTERTPGEPRAAPASKDVEAIRGHYAERRRMLDIWDRQQRSRRAKK